jgi:hypothetical protein
VALLALVLAITVYIHAIPTFLAGEILSDLAWEYSALVSLPLAWLVLRFGLADRTVKGPHIVLVPLALYFVVARLVIAVPNVGVYLGNYPPASKVVMVKDVRSDNFTCRHEAGVDLVGYSQFVFDLCVPQALGATLRPGDKLRVEGKAGLGGLLVLNTQKL